MHQKEQKQLVTNFLPELSDPNVMNPKFDIRQVFWSRSVPNEIEIKDDKTKKTKRYEKSLIIIKNKLCQFC